MKPIISKNLTPLPPFPTLAQRAEGWEGGFQSLSPLRGEVYKRVLFIHSKLFKHPLSLNIIISKN
jgi:hypothetical protein